MSSAQVPGVGGGGMSQFAMGRHTGPSSLMFQEPEKGGLPERERRDDSCLERRAT